MEIDINNEEIKKNVISKMKENRSFERIEDEFQFGVLLAIDEIRNNIDENSIYYNPFKNSDKNEIIALQLIFQYLKKRGFQFTLSCLLNESNSKSQFDENMKNFDIKDIIQSHDIQSEQNRNYPIEPPKVITKSDFNNFECIMKIDEL